MIQEAGPVKTLAAAFIVGAIVVAVASWYTSPRYQLARIRDNFVVRLDGRTGSMDVFIFADAHTSKLAENQGLGLFHVRPPEQ